MLTRSWVELMPFEILRCEHGLARLFELDLRQRIYYHEHFGDALTGRLSVAWSPTESRTLRAAIGTGHKSPTFIEMFGYFPGQFHSNPQLQPEESTSYELGIEQRVQNGRSPSSA